MGMWMIQGRQEVRDQLLWFIACDECRGRWAWQHLAAKGHMSQQTHVCAYKINLAFHIHTDIIYTLFVSVVWGHQLHTCSSLKPNNKWFIPQFSRFGRVTGVYLFCIIKKRSCILAHQFCQMCFLASLWTPRCGFFMNVRVHRCKIQH